MKGVIFFSLTILLCAEYLTGQVLDPKWLKIIRTSDLTVFMDTTNVKQADYQLTIVSLTLFDNPKFITEYKKEAKSVKSQVLFNLNLRKYTILGSLFYDNQLKIIGESSLPGFSLSDEAFSLSIDSNEIMKSLYEKSISMLKIDTTKYYSQGTTSKENRLRALIENSGPLVTSAQNTQQTDQTAKEEKKENSAKEVEKNLHVGKPTVKVNNIESNDYDILSEKNVRSTIFTDGKKFCYQVSSWKILKQAESEIQRLKRKGEDAFIVEANIPSKGGKWYRVRIGYFNSLEETENYLQKMK